MLISNLFASFVTILQTACIVSTIGQHLHSNNGQINYSQSNDHHHKGHGQPLVVTKNDDSASLLHEPTTNADSYVNGNSHRQAADQKPDSKIVLRPRRSSIDDLLAEKTNHNIQTDRDLFAITSSCIEPLAGDERFRLQRVPCSVQNMDMYRTFLRNLFKLPSQTLVKFMKASNENPTIDDESVMKFFEKLNLSGDKQLPLFVQEPDFHLVRDKVSPNVEVSDFFVPPRGRKDGRTGLLDLNDQFFPNRGKKLPLQPSKKGSARDLLAQDLFVPNRGKKSLALLNDDDSFFPNRGKKLMEDYYQQRQGLDALYKSMGWKRGGLNSLLQDGDDFMPNRGKKSKGFGHFLQDDIFMPNRGKKMTGSGLDKLIKDDFFIPNRGRKKRNDDGSVQDPEQNRRDLLTSLAKDDKDPFFVARGRRASIPPDYDSEILLPN